MTATAKIVNIYFGMVFYEYGERIMIGNRPVGAITCKGVVSSLVMAATFGFSSPVWAQDNEGAEKAGIEEIVVTAQRREESLQDVPISIVAIGSEELRNRNVTDMSRLEQVAPGLQLGRSGTDARPAMRGTYTEQIQGNSDPRIGFYIDEVYQSRTSQLSVPFVDLQRVEVQKGPQGTLYGRNSFGGNIALVSNAPTDESESGFDLLYGDYDRLMVNAFVNIPLSEGLATRFAGSIEKRDPYITSLTNPAASYDDLNQQYIRGALRWAPPAADNGLEVIVRGSYWTQDDAGANTFNSKAIGQFIDQSLVRQPGETLTIGDSTFTFPLGFNGRSYTGEFVPYSTFRDGIPDLNGADIGILIPGPYEALNNEPNFNKVDSVQFSANINVDLTDSLTLRSITSYTDFKADRGGDNDGSAAPWGRAHFITENEAFSQEIQLQSNDSESPLQYTVGAYFLVDKVADGFLSDINQNYSTATALANGQVPLYYGSAFTFDPTFASPLNQNDSWNPLSYMKTESTAIYGQASYTLTERFTLTGGLRYTIDDKEFKSALGNRAPGFFDPTYVVFEPTVDFNHECGGFTAASPSSTASDDIIAEALITRCGDETFDFVTYRVAAEYDVSDDVMLYASHSTGKRSGGFSYSVIPGTSDESLPFVEEESVKAFEVGLKGLFLDNRVQVNLAGYYNEYTDLQVQRSFPNPVNSQSVITVAGNGGTGDTPGIDLEILAEPIDGLRINLAANWMRARIDPFPEPTFNGGLCDIVDPGGTCDTNPEVAYGYGGAILPNPVNNPELFVPILDENGQQVVTSGGTPLFDALGYNREERVQNQADFTLRAGIAYDINLGNLGTLTPEIQTYYNGGYLLSPLMINFEQDAYTKTDAYISWRGSDEALSVQAYVQNLEDEAVIGRVTTGNRGSFNGTFQPPRTWGVRVGYRF